jgi:hypothetical protein
MKILNVKKMVGKNADEEEKESEGNRTIYGSHIGVHEVMKSCGI